MRIWISGEHSAGSGGWLDLLILEIFSTPSNDEHIAGPDTAKVSENHVWTFPKTMGMGTECCLHHFTNFLPGSLSLSSALPKTCYKGLKIINSSVCICFSPAHPQTLKDITPHPAMGKEHLPLFQISPSPIQPVHENFQGQGSHNFSGQQSPTASEGFIKNFPCGGLGFHTKSPCLGAI